MDDDNRPTWPHKEMTEAAFRRVYGHGLICKLEAKWEMTSADTGREWLEATNTDGKMICLPDSWKVAFEFDGGASNPGMLWLNYVGKAMLKTYDEINEWEAKNKRDRSEFERLKAKFVT